MYEYLAKIFGKRIINSATDCALSLFKEPKMVEAFKNACDEVVAKESLDYSSETLQALAYKYDSQETSNFWDKLEKEFAESKFPSIENLSKLLLTNWTIRKSKLVPSESADFFLLDKESVKPILDKISEFFFKNLSLVPEFSCPFIIKELKSRDNSEKKLVTKETMQNLLDLDQLEKTFENASRSLLAWPTVLGKGVWLERDEYDVIFDRIQNEKASTTILLGKPGSGKSAFLAYLGKQLTKTNTQILAIKADKIPSEINTFDQLSTFLELPASIDACITRMSANRKVVLIIDQLDALSEIVDQKTNRLNLLLNLINLFSNKKNIHLISSSRLFEFKHDSRLNSIDAEQLVLVPPKWLSIKNCLENCKINSIDLSNEVKAILEIPLHLKIFLDLQENTPEGDLVITLQSLLEALWQRKVLTNEKSLKTLDLITLVTKYMAENEDLWVPKALVDNYVSELAYLIRNEILILEETGLRIGFRHQTYFDFARARSFVKGGERISDYLYSRQDSLFIRPTLISTLTYLRGANLRAYNSELKAIWEFPELRLHLKTLLIELLGSQRNPNHTEISCLVPLFCDLDFQDKVLSSIAGSPDWYSVINSTCLETIMRQPPEKASKCSCLLQEAVKFLPAQVVVNLEKTWLVDPIYDELSLGVLRHLESWNENYLETVCLIVMRSESWQIPFICKSISEFKPNLAPKIVKIYFDKALMKAKAEDFLANSKNIEQKEVSLEEVIQKSFLENNVKSLLDKVKNWYDLEEIAIAAPKSFIEELWPWFCSFLECLNIQPNSRLLKYLDDSCLGTKLHRESFNDGNPVLAIFVAIEEFASHNPKDFLLFFEDQQKSCFLSIHRLLCKGLLQLVADYPQICLTYLLENPKRLSIGDFEDQQRESKDLISALAVHLKKKDIIQLEKSINEFNFYALDVDSKHAKDRQNTLKWNRKNRLELLLSIPNECRSDDIKKQCIEEQRIFPLNNSFSSNFKMGFVGSPMTSEQMQKGKSADVLNLFKEITDSTGWDHPRRSQSGKLIGGSVQAGRAFRKLAEEHPQKAVEIIDSLDPEENSSTAGFGIEGLAEAEFPATELFNLILDLYSKGFVSPSFKISVANALSKISESNKGLPENVISLLKSFLPDFEHPKLTTIESVEDNEPSESILWGYGQLYALPGGRDLIISAIAKGFLFQSPKNYYGWTNALEKILITENHPEVLKTIIRFIPPIFEDKSQRILGEKLLNQIFEIYPSVLQSSVAIRTIAIVLHTISNFEYVESWLIQLRKFDSQFSQQAFGELVFLCNCVASSFDFAESELKFVSSQEGLIGIKRGIAFAASYCWDYSKIQKKCTESLVSLATILDLKVVEAIATIINRKSCLTMNMEMRKIINAILANDILLIETSNNLLDFMITKISIFPDLIYQVSERILLLKCKEIHSIQSKFSALAEPLVSIAITLHHMPEPHRARGLSLFESLSKNDIYEAKKALEVLDRKPIKEGGPELFRKSQRIRKRLKVRSK